MSQDQWRLLPQNTRKVKSEANRWEKKFQRIGATFLGLRRNEVR